MAVKAVIIGSGVGGLAIAIRLALKGYQVSVYEKNMQPGGKLTAFEKDGFFFDAGPSLFTQPQLVTELFALAGESFDDYFSYRPVEIACNYFFDNGKRVRAYTHAASFAQEMKTQLNEPEETVTRYLRQSAELYNNIGTFFLSHSLHKRATWLKNNVGKALSTLTFGYLFQSLHKYNSSKFTTPEATQLFNRFATYNGSNPYQAPAMLSLIPHLEQNQGTYYPEGGMISITNALYQLARKKGVEFYFDSPVNRILHQGGKITGVEVNGNNILSDIVVSNADVYFTYKHLLQHTAKANMLKKQERSSSAVVFYWGMKRKFTQLELHNIFFSGDYKREFDCIFKTKQMSDDPTVYINITSKMESGQAPQGKENWFVMINAPADYGQNWAAVKTELRKNVIKKLSRMLGEELEPLIETEQILDPLLIAAQTGSFLGAIYGSSSNSRLAAFFRHANFSATLSGLYFCGGSVHPGGGIPLCLSSAKIVSDLVSEDRKKDTPVIAGNSRMMKSDH